MGKPERRETSRVLHPKRQEKWRQWDAARGQTECTFLMPLELSHVELTDDFGRNHFPGETGLEFQKERVKE